MARSSDQNGREEGNEGYSRLDEIQTRGRRNEKERKNEIESDISIFIFTSPFNSILSRFSVISCIHILILDPKIGKHGRLHDNPHRGGKKSKKKSLADLSKNLPSRRIMRSEKIG